MCGRFTLTLDENQLIKTLNHHFNTKYLPKGVSLPRFNIAPSQQVLGIINQNNQLHVSTFKWGFLPTWWKPSSPLPPMINAKSETIDTLKVFKNAFQHKRCVILATGFYEWDQQTKTPYYFYSPHQPLFAFAGVYEYHPVKGATTAILTKPAYDGIKVHHDRGPVILNVDTINTWLNSTTSMDEIHAIINNAAPLLHNHPVNKTVNYVNNDTSALIEKSVPLTLFDL